MFKLLKLDIPDGKKPVYLLIDSNGSIPYHEFQEQISNEGNYDTELDTISTLILSRARNEPLPRKKFKPLEGRAKWARVKDFEYKTKMLRVYVFEYNGGDVIWGGEKKDPNAQKRTITRMRSDKRKFYDQANSTGITIEDEEDN